MLAVNHSPGNEGREFSSFRCTSNGGNTGWTRVVEVQEPRWLINRNQEAWGESLQEDTLPKKSRAGGASFPASISSCRNFHVPWSYASVISNLLHICTNGPLLCRVFCWTCMMNWSEGVLLLYIVIAVACSDRIGGISSKRMIGL